MTTEQNIKDWVDRALKKGMEREDIIFLIVQVRHLIEGKHNISDYRAAELYCNWIVHTNLYSSDGGLFIIRDLMKVLANNWSKTKETVAEEISKVFGLSNLRLELTKLFKDHSIPTIIFSEDDNWKNMVGFLIYYLRGKPIHFPNGSKVKKQHLKDLIYEIKNIEKPVDFYIKNVLIVGNKTPLWCIELGGGKNTRILSPIEI